MPTTLKHGTTSTYRHGCRCADCKAAKSADYRAYVRAKKEVEAVLKDGAGNVVRRSRDPASNVMAFEGLDPADVEIMVDLCWYWVKQGVPIPEATTRARNEVLDLP